jgi:ribosomal protein L40E
MVRVRLDSLEKSIGNVGGFRWGDLATKLDLIVKGAVIAIIGPPLFYCGDFMASNMTTVQQHDGPALYQTFGLLTYLGILLLIAGAVVVCVGIAATPKKQGAVMFCPNCGYKLKPKAVSCRKCGCKLSSKKETVRPISTQKGNKERV